MTVSLDIDKCDAENLARITQIKKDLGSRLVILGHYYQRLSIAKLSNHLGDSFGLSSLAARSDSARYIVFCGVEFMAESAEILRAPHQAVFHPSETAGCPMAEMAHIDQVESAFLLAERTLGKKIIPVAYMNTSSEIKAFCGRRDGLVCTSSNAPKAFQWALDRGSVVFFLPDENLGVNTSDLLRIPGEARAVFDPSLSDEENLERLNGQTRVVLWKGYCHVHTWFTPEHVASARSEHPGAQVVVHPECTREVVALSDQAGSTAFMHRFTKEAPAGSTVIIGTEINMVDYLNHEYGKAKIVLPLNRSFCPNMFKINLRNLRETLENLSSDRFRVEVDPETKKHARLALSRMLELER